VTGFFAIVLIAGSAWWVWDGGFAVTVSFYLFYSYTCKPDGRFRPKWPFNFVLKLVSVNQTITAMAGLSCIHPMAWPVRSIVLMALALVTEGLQFFAINRHPGLGEVVIDMAGLVTGLLLAGYQLGHDGKGDGHCQSRPQIS